MLQIITKTSPEGLWYFELYNSSTKQTVTSSDLLFDPKFFKKNRSKEELQIISEKSQNISGQTKEKQKIVNGNDLIVHIGSRLLESNQDLKDNFKKLVNSFILEDKQKPNIRILAVCFHLLQFLTSEGYLNGSSKLVSLAGDYKECGEQIQLEKLYFFAVEKIDQQTSIHREAIARVKSFQGEGLIKTILKRVFDESKFKQFVKRKKIDTVAVIPNNAVRKISFNEEIEKYLKKKYPELQFIKITVNDFPERKTQKSTRGLCERLENADKLMSVKTIPKTVKNVLLIDDVFGSGATMNMVAKKIKALSPDANIIGFAILSSYRKGFDIVNEI